MAKGVGNPLIFKDSEAAKLAIMDSQKKEIAALYESWADEIGERAKYYSHKSTASAPLSERYYRELQKQLRETSQQVSNEVYGIIKNNTYTVADAVVADNVKWLEQFGFSAKGLNAAFSYVPDSVVRNLFTGQIYDSGWSLSSRIWGDNENTLKEIYKVMAGGLAQQKPIYEIAKDLEKYVRPSAAKPWNLVAPDGRKIYPKQIDYNAQRLARTLVQHGYQQSFVATTQKNPFITEYIWRSNGSRVCDLCKARDGVHYKKNELPLDHPNGMCTMEPAIAEDMIDQLADWFNSPDGTFPEIDEFAGNFGYHVSKTGTVKDFLDKYGTSTKSPNAWFNSLTPIQKAEAKALKDESGLTWNQWYEKNIYAGDGSNLGKKAKVKVFSSAQDKYLSPYGFSPSNMPKTFDDWSHKISYEQASEILKSMGASWSDPHPYQQLMKYYTQHLTDKSFVAATKTTTKAVTSTTSTVGAQFDAAAWREALRRQNLGTMESWCDDWVAKLTATQKNAVVRYTGSAYERMNDYLRAAGSIDESDATKSLIKQCQAALKKASLPEETIVRRGSGYNMLQELGIDVTEANKDKIIGGIVQDLGFMSTSPNATGGFSGSIEYVIKVPQGSQAMYVAPISNFYSEQELLINCGGKFMVDDVEFEYGSVKRIYMTLKNLK